MKVVKKNVYYCDYCKGRKLTKNSMARHEERCTANPKRWCFLCDEGIDVGEYVAELKLRFEITTVQVKDQYCHILSAYLHEYEKQVCEWIGAPITLKEIMDKVDGCPNCTLAVLRQSHLNYTCCGLEEFKYKELFAEFSKQMQKIRNDEFRSIAGY